MAKRPKTESLKSATLSPDRMRAAIPKLRKRIDELQSVDIDSIQSRDDPKFDALEKKIDATLAQTFDIDTVEYRKFSITSLDLAPMNFMYETPLNEVKQGYKDGIDHAISNLQTVIELFEEQIEGGEDSATERALKALGELELHPEIERASGKLFRNEHYANAVEDACKVLDGLVKVRSGKSDLSGTELMHAVFSPKNPVLRFNNLETETDRSEQQGMMFLYAGAMLAFRNPRAHQIIEDDPEKALEYIGFLSLLAKSLDDAERS